MEMLPINAGGRGRIVDRHGAAGHIDDAIAAIETDIELARLAS